MTSEVIPPVREGDATLRMLTAADLPLTLAWRNHPDSRAWFLSTAVLEPHQHELWFEAYQRREDDYVFIVEVDQTARAQVALYNISPAGAEFGRLLVDPDARGQGFSHRVIALCIRAAKERLALPKLTLEVKQDNVAALRAYDRAGFTEVRRDSQGIVHMEVRLT